MMDRLNRTAARPSDTSVWLLALALAGSACTAEDDPAESGSSGGQDTDGGTPLPEGCDFFVEPGEAGQEDLTTALVDVAAGQTVCMAEGTFMLTRQLAITAADVTLRGAGMDQTVLNFSQQISGGNGVLIEADRVTVEDFSVIDTPGDGIRSNDVDGGVYRRVKAGWTTPESLDNGAYALYPVQSSNIYITECVAYHARDAGLYIGQSNNVLIENSEAYGNVIGLEIENTTDAVVRNNDVHGNTAGILLINLPGLDVFDGKRANVYGNTITGNNVTNFGDPGMTVGILPPGVGVLVVATDANEVWDNDIRDNKSAAVAMIGYLPVLFGDPNDPEFDIYSQGNYIHDNQMSNNATAPDQLVLVLNGNQTPGPEVVVDGCADPTLPADPSRDNCLSIGDATFLNTDSCNQADGPTEDPSAFGCTQPALPTDIPGLG